MNIFKYILLHERGLDEDEFIIFAPNQRRALEIYASFINIRVDLAGWTGEEWERFKVSGRPEQLRKALDRGQEGLGIFDLEHGWVILPPDWNSPEDGLDEGQS